MRGRGAGRIAQALFVTIKTVEVHLGHVYAKLAIRGRSQLSDALDIRAVAPAASQLTAP